MDIVSYKTVSANKSTVEKKWYIVDAGDATLGRLCSEVAKILRGKHKPSYTPHVDCGDKVVIINADNLRLTGKKMDDKEYVRHTGYPGGQRFSTPRQEMAKSSTRVIEKAIKGMLPKNTLGRQVFKNMHVYEGTEHPHEAQQPQKLDLSHL
ncbi:50S ribosomal protein L13 [Catalinimonas niigatensis]|uniref:50S ribosomal protein L13 n=1 Tax=Catalinimonas niigatensis TaxID=1397264 RepID=UPI0026669199|nr:50S ribosomal protein L13 [Catalinimonas niigatensis]WPP53692.1 50S ribosomal protein L13 [Catalinimonas niigatensis]